MIANASEITDPTSLGTILQAGGEIEIAGALFDMDGTLVDSLNAVETAWEMWAAEYAIPAPAKNMHGRSARAVVRLSGISEDERPQAEARLQDIEARPGQRLDSLPGASALLSALPENRWGVVTSATRPVAYSRLKAAGLSQPTLLVTGDDVTRGKPDPEPFQQGLTELRSRGYEGVVIALEDSIAGLTSARAAGCFVIAIAAPQCPEALSSQAHLVVSSLEQLKLNVDAHAVYLRLTSPAS